MMPETRNTRLVLLALLALVCSSACTTNGIHVPGRRAQMDFGPRVGVRLCLLADNGVSEARARALVDAIDREMDAYALDVTTLWVRPWTRPGFFGGSIIDDVVSRPLEPPCDRLVAMVGRHFGDVLWGLLLPETLGAVETTTRTRGYVVAKFASTGQILTPPSNTASHEFYHMLGCRHALTKSRCYQQIQALKRDATSPDFFPGMDQHGRVLRSRDEVERRLAPWLRPGPVSGRR